MIRRNFLKTILGLIPTITLVDSIVKCNKTRNIYGNCTRFYFTSETLSDLRNWHVEYLDDRTKKEIFFNINKPMVKYVG